MTAPAERTRQVEGYRLSFQQQRLWRLAELGVPSWAQLLVTADGDLDAERLAAALHGTVARHEILRASYQRVPGVRTALLVVRDPDDLRPHWIHEDLRHLDEAARSRRIDEAARDERRMPHGGPDEPLLRATLFALGTGRHALLLTTTALAADGPALRLLADELAQRYAGAPPAEEVLQYSQFAEWQHQEYGEQQHSAGSAESPTRRLSLPLRRPEGSGGPERRTVTAPLPDGVTAAVHAYARRRRVRPGAVLLACWQTLLGRISGQRDLTVGTLLTGREYEETATAVGPFAHWADVSARLDSTVVLDALAARAERALSDAEEAHDETPSAGGTGPAGHDIGFVCQDLTATPDVRAGGTDGVTFTVLWDDVETEHHALRLQCALGPAEGRTTWHYDGEQFDDAYVRVLADQYATLLAALLAAPADPVRRMRLPAAATAAPLQNRPPEPADGFCLHHLVERQIRRTPDALAVVAAAERLTFRELGTRADRWSRSLRARGVGVETPVAVSAAHSAPLLVALLAVLKAGGTYVPLDPQLPPLRARELMERAGCRLLLTDRPDEADVPRGVECVDVRGLPSDEADAGVGTDEARPDDLAYIMFTSGSTGAPKGVMLPHRAVCDYLLWSARTYHDGGGAEGAAGAGGAMAHSSIAFDLTVTSLFLPLVTGRPVHLDPAWRDAVALSTELADRSGLDVLKLTPSHLKVVNHAVDPADLADITGSLVLGGETLHGEAVAPWLAGAPGTRVFNEYGPTETAVGVCVHEVGAEDARPGPVPIGRPMDHAEVLVLDEDLEPVAVGVPGELHIGGTSLARGYAGAPDATAERFVPHPFSPEPGRRLYRTGDLACVGPDGLIHCLGRVDDQIKVNGVRVEPEEIRAALLRHPGVRDAAVVLVTDEERGDHLTACVVTTEDAGNAEETEATTTTATDTPGTDTGPQALRDFLAERLPAQLVPSTYARTRAIPLTPNGKVDQAAVRALAPDGGAAQAVPAAGRTGTPPHGPVETAVARVFGELLGAGPVAADDDFFDLGGHSLLAVRLIARLNAEFGTALRVPVLFTEPDPDAVDPDSPATPRHLARLLTARAAADLALSEDIVALRPRGEGTPLFCVHPAGGEAIGFRHLAARSELRSPLYALQTPPTASADGAPHEDQSVEALAARYLKAIRTVAPTGPYLLLGWSMGGLVAFEMARLLEQQGERTAMLFLVESYLSEQLPDSDEDSDEAAGADGADAGGETDAERLDLDLRLRANRTHLRAARAYRPSAYVGPVSLVQADRQDPDVRQAAARSWSRVCAPEQLTRHVLEGDHLTLFTPPYVTELARLIDRLTPETP
ncbi:non-ribosomal peptide synthetase [Streptomyces silaceus]|uniref:non-ribosomal peptide synthetase n=1 Tax=Streptomyces silaceus TaxID=545123 RepID=UPI0006EBBADD|nr:non-ribosomal peptide synthetase [Streptomyces silaceus]